MQEEAISIEETNKLRLKVGLAPIPIASDTKYSDKEVSTENELSLEDTNRLRISLGLQPIDYKIPSQQQQNDDSNSSIASQNKPLNEELLKDRIQQVKDDNKRKRKLKFSKTLLDDYEEQSTDDWLNSLTKKQKPDKDLKDLKRTSYSNLLKDSVAMEVSHNIKDLNELQENDIFTLEDDDILAENDKLSNERLRTSAKVAKDLNELSKIRDIKAGTDYQPLNDEKYDTENVLLLGLGIKLTSDEIKEVIPEGKVKIGSLFDDPQNEDKSVKPIKMKKLKNKKIKVSKRIRNEDELGENFVLKPVENDKEEDLEEILNRERRLKQLKRKFLNSEDFAKEIRLTIRTQLENDLDKLQMVATTVFDQTDDFLNNLPPPITHDEYEDNSNNSNRITEATDEANTNDISFNDNSKETIENSNKNHKEDNLPSFSRLGLTLKYLKSNVLVEESKNKNKIQRETEEKAKEIKLKLLEQRQKVTKALETDPVYQNLPEEKKHDYYEAKLDETLYESNLLQDSRDLLSNYKPQIELTYKDSKGNLLDSKQAFKQLSANYHGTKKAHPKGSKNKFK